jgi:hypothetical protein
MGARHEDTIVREDLRTCFGRKYRTRRDWLY